MIHESANNGSQGMYGYNAWLNKSSSFRSGFILIVGVMMVMSVFANDNRTSSWAITEANLLSLSGMEDNWTYIY